MDYFQCPRCRMKVKSNVPFYHKLIKAIISKGAVAPWSLPLKVLLHKNQFLHQVKDDFFSENKVYSYQMLFADSLEFAKQLPTHFDCIIGIPRNGLMVASIIASYLGLPLSTPDDYLLGKVWRSRSIKELPIKNVLLVDEIVATGRNMTATLEHLKDAPATVVTASLLQCSFSQFPLDYCFRKLPKDTVCEWEIKHEGEFKICQ